jgi:hypothetical protein
MSSPQDPQPIILRAEQRSGPGPRGGIGLKALGFSPYGQILWTVNELDGSWTPLDEAPTPRRVRIAAFAVDSLRLIGSVTAPGGPASMSLLPIGEQSRTLLGMDKQMLLCDVARGTVEPLPLPFGAELVAPPFGDLAGQWGVLPVHDATGTWLMVLDLGTCQLRAKLPYHYGARAISGDGRVLVQFQSVHGTGELDLFRPRDGHRLATLRIGSEYWHWAVLAVDPIGKCVVVLSAAQLCCIEIPTGTICWQQTIREPGTLAKIWFSPTGRTLWLASGILPDRLSAFAAADGSRLPLAEGAVSWCKQALAQNGNHLAGDLNPGILLLELRELPLHVRRVQPSSVDSVALLPALRLLATAGRSTGTITCYAYEGAALGPCRTLVCSGVPGVRELHAGHDGRTLFVVGLDGSLWSWDPDRGVAPKKWPCPYIYSSMFTLEPGGYRAACGHGFTGARERRYSTIGRPKEQDALTVWDTRTGELLADYPSHPPRAQSMAWLSGQADTLHLRSGMMVWPINPFSREQAALCGFPLDRSFGDVDPTLLPDGLRVLTVVYGQLVTWNLAKERVDSRLGQSAGVRVLAVSPSSQRVLVAKHRKVQVLRTDREPALEAEFDMGSDDSAYTACFDAAGIACAIVGASQRLLLVRLGTD